MDRIVILDFGSQTTALIGRRIRELGIYAEILPGDATLSDEDLAGVHGIILSGSPQSVYDGGAQVDQRIYQCGLPLLGICYGLQRMTVDLGGRVEALAKREAGGIEVTIGLKSPSILKKPNWDAMNFFSGFLLRDDLSLWNIFTGNKCISSFNAWMSHGDTLVELAPGFVEAGSSANGYPAIVYHREKPWFGLQFHPEVSHCELGNAILASFVTGVCRCPAVWNMKDYLDKTVAALQTAAADKTILLLISGGVDSTVAAALLLRALPPEQLHLMYLDTGLMRKDETIEVRQILKSLGARHIHIVHCADEFFAALAGLTAPEEKRTAIGDLFIRIQEREVEKLNLPGDYLLVQGTLYTDLIESGKGVGKKARLIKSHHNVGSPLVEAKRAVGKILEPLDKLYKDEVRALGRLLGIDEAVVGRHPFPGPGLAVRILGEVTAEKCATLREADALFISELKARQNPLTGKCLYDEIWQAFAVLLPLRSVGVAGDERRYGWVLALRAVTSTDGMTADVYPFNAKDIIEISTLITNTVQEIGRITFDISSKPPATIEWE
ncbi:MAG: glutamine-hydrolyzing GMP synthase [Spirochaetaceae bacterium]|nr:glutamine-hydrolyzing GMP synthase [Spirochaetaceae bacterium]